MAVEYAPVTEMVALQAARLEGSVASLREERLEEKGRARAPGNEPAPLNVGDVLGSGGSEVDLAVKLVEGLQLLLSGQESSISAVAVAPRDGT